MWSWLVESPRGTMAARGLRFQVSILTCDSRVSLWLLLPLSPHAQVPVVLNSS